mgnify:CR=1 FL=1
MTVYSQWCTYLINLWEAEYSVPLSTYIRFIGFQHFTDEKLLGRTWMKQKDDYLFCEIALSEKLDKDWKIKAVLWHEFCHAWAYCDTGKSQSHGWEWVKRFWKKPVMAVLDLII